MKIKYIFDTIYSNADTIKVSSGTEDIITLSKADFQNSWSNVIGNEYFIKDVQCSDLQNLEVSGAENHTVKFDEDTNQRWKEFTKNKIGSKHFDDPLVLDNLDPTLPVKFYNQEDVTNYNNFVSFLYNANRILSTKNREFTYDISHLKVPFFDNLPAGAYFTPIRKTDSGAYLSLMGSGAYKISDPYSAANRYKKWFDIPEGVKNIDWGFYGSHIEESPKLPSSIVSMDNTFYESHIKKLPIIPEKVTNLYYTFYKTDISSIDFSKLENISGLNYTFRSCESLENLGDIILPNATSLSSTFTGCSSLHTVGDIILPNVTSLSYTFSDCNSLHTVGDISLPIVTSFSRPFNECSSLTTVGDISLPNVTSLSYAFSGCSSLTTVGDISLPNTISISELFSGTSLKSIGNFYAPKLNNDGASFPGYMGSIGNITCSGSLSSLRVDSVGIYNSYGGSSSSLLARWPKTAVALPYYFVRNFSGSAGISADLPTSTGYNVWVDYVNDTGTDFVHNITNPILNITEDKETLNKSETIHFSNLNILEKNASYDHTFVVKSSKVQIAKITKTATNVTLNDIRVVDNKDGTVDIDIPCINIADDSVSSGSISFPVAYVAKIDDYEFHGGTKVTINFTFNWQINETIGINASIVEDDE